LSSGRDVPPHAPPRIEIQKQIFRELLDDFVPYQSVIIEPAGELGSLERTRYVMKRTLEECVLIHHTTDFVIIHGVRKNPCLNIKGTWTKDTFEANKAIKH
jgi:hypothetical protein